MSKIIQGDSLTVLKSLSEKSINCCVTSPPYWGLRDYGHEEQIGLEETPEEYVSKLVEVFKEVKRVLMDNGTLWLNLGDSYSGSNSTKDAVINPNSLSAKAGHTLGGISKARGIVGGLKSKDLVGIPWLVAFALRYDGWYLRQDIIWAKPNPMPESVTDRCTKAHEYIFLLSKSAQYYFDSKAIEERATAGYRDTDFMPTSQKDILDKTQVKSSATGASLNGRDGEWKETRNKRSVWTISTKPYSGAHFATFPEELINPCILAGCPEGGTVLDPFFGAGTTGVVCKNYRREYLGIELNPEYVKIAEQRLAQVQVPFL